MINKQGNPLRDYILSTVFLSLIFLFFLIKLFTLQIIDNEKYSLKSKKIIYREDIIPAQRGRIFDRKYQTVFADNREIYQIKLDYGLFPEEKKESIFTLLSSELEISYDYLNKLYDEGKANKENSIRLIENAPFKNVIFLSEHQEELPGIYYLTDNIRIYQDVRSLSHILGYLGKINPTEYKLMVSKGYHMQSWVGREGVEKYYDSVLKGKDGIQRRSVDFKERVVTEREIIKEPVPGEDLVLTIDSKIQMLCERALGNRSGSVVVMKPHNGEILAMVSWPWYDNNFNTHSDRVDLYRRYQQNLRFPLINRAIQSKYAPASTFKIIMSAALLDSNLLDPEKKIACLGYKKIGNRVFHCHQHSGHGYLNLDQAIAESCNVYFYTAGYDYLKDPFLIKSYANEFGYGKLTQIDLPGETEGLVPDPDWLKKERNSYWVGGDTVNISIGQGNLLVTPLQLACAISMVCNDGKLIRPHLLKEFRDPYSHKEISSFEAVVNNEVHWDKEVFSKIRLGMRHVVSKGTARYVISTKAVESAGKTGTGEVGKKERWHSWFVGFAPWDAPVEQQIVVVVMVEADNDWEFWSAKACNVILQGIFANQTYEQTIKVLGAWFGS